MNLSATASDIRKMIVITGHGDLVKIADELSSNLSNEHETTCLFLTQALEHEKQFAQTVKDEFLWRKFGYTLAVTNSSIALLALRNAATLYESIDDIVFYFYNSDGKRQEISLVDLHNDRNTKRTVHGAFMRFPTDFADVWEQLSMELIYNSTSTPLKIS